MPLLPAFEGVPHTPDAVWFDHRSTTQLGCAPTPAATSQPYTSYGDMGRDDFGLDEQTLRHVQAMYDSSHAAAAAATPAPPAFGTASAATSSAHTSNPPTPLNALDTLPLAGFPFPNVSPAMYSPVSADFEALLNSYTQPGSHVPHTPLSTSFASSVPHPPIGSGSATAYAGNAPSSLQLQHPSPLRAVPASGAYLTPALSGPAGPGAAYGTPASSSSQLGALSPTPALTHCSTVQSTPHQLTPHHRSLSSCSSFSSLSLPPAQHPLALHPLTRVDGAGTGADADADGDRPKRAFYCTDPGCPRSKRSFLSNADLQRHLNSHEGRKPYTCDVAGCGKRYGQNYRLLTHIQKHHPGVSVDDRRSRASSTRAQVLARRRAIEAGGIGAAAAFRHAGTPGLSGLGFEVHVPSGSVDASGNSLDLELGQNTASDLSLFYPSPASTFASSFSAASTPATSLSTPAARSALAGPSSAPAAHVPPPPPPFAALGGAQATPTPSPSALLRRRRTAPYPALSLPLGLGTGAAATDAVYALPPGFGGLASSC